MSVGISLKNNAFNAIVQVMPWSEQVLVTERIPSDDFKDMFGDICEMNEAGVLKELGQKAVVVGITVNGDINNFLNDMIDVYEAKGFTAKYANYRKNA